MEESYILNDIKGENKRKLGRKEKKYIEKKEKEKEKERRIKKSKEEKKIKHKKKEKMYYVSVLPNGSVGNLNSPA